MNASVSTFGELMQDLFPDIIIVLGLLLLVYWLTERIVIQNLSQLGSVNDEMRRQSRQIRVLSQKVKKGVPRATDDKATYNNKTNGISKSKNSGNMNENIKTAKNQNAKLGSFNNKNKVNQAAKPAKPKSKFRTWWEFIIGAQTVKPAKASQKTNKSANHQDIPFDPNSVRGKSRRSRALAKSTENMVNRSVPDQPQRVDSITEVLSNDQIGNLEDKSILKILHQLKRTQKVSSLFFSEVRLDNEGFLNLMSELVDEPYKIKNCVDGSAFIGLVTMLKESRNNTKFSYNELEEFEKFINFYEIVISHLEGIGSDATDDELLSEYINSSQSLLKLQNTDNLEPFTLNYWIKKLENKIGDKNE